MEPRGIAYVLLTQGACRLMSLQVARGVLSMLRTLPRLGVRPLPWRAQLDKIQSPPALLWMGIMHILRSLPLGACTHQLQWILHYLPVLITSEMLMYLLYLPLYLQLVEEPRQRLYGLP